MRFTKETKIVIVGMGVIGGSYALGFTKNGYKVYCITRKQSDIDYALEHKMVEGGACFPDPEIISKADVLVLALYPKGCIQWMEEHKGLLTPGTLVTDVSGVKSCLVPRMQELMPEGVEFISAHPMAGRECSGIAYSDDKVFKGANFIITPTEKNTSEAVEVCREMAKVLGFARISTLSIEQHDKMIANLSQLTHCIAVTLMTYNMTPNAELYTGDSFRDLTRIAKINDRMWSELFLENKEILLDEMDAFAREFTKLREYIAGGDEEGMRSMMRLSTERRSLFDKPKG